MHLKQGIHACSMEKKETQTNFDIFTGSNVGFAKGNHHRHTVVF